MGPAVPRTAVALGAVFVPLVPVTLLCPCSCPSFSAVPITSVGFTMPQLWFWGSSVPWGLVPGSAAMLCKPRDSCKRLLPPMPFPAHSVQCGQRFGAEHSCFFFFLFFFNQLLVFFGSRSVPTCPISPFWRSQHHPLPSIPDPQGISPTHSPSTTVIYFLFHNPCSPPTPI